MTRLDVKIVVFYAAPTSTRPRSAPDERYGYTLYLRKEKTFDLSY